MTTYNHESTSAAYKDDYYVYQSYDGPIATAPLVMEESAGTESSDKDYLESTTRFSSWCIANNASLSEDEIKLMFQELRDTFGFQVDNAKNMFEYLMILLDSRSSRMSCDKALRSVHADYIGGQRSNFKKWYFSVHVFANVGKSSDYKESSKQVPKDEEDLASDENCMDEAEWNRKMNSYTHTDYIYQIGLYLLIWGEANNIRFMPECLCFIYQCAFDHFYDVKSKSLTIVKTQYTFLDEVITPLYCFIRDQQMIFKNGNWIKNTKDHKSIIGYDDANQFFWSPTALKKIKIDNGTKLFDLSEEKRYQFLKSIKWNSLFYKTYYERRSWIHALTNFSRVWVIHITMFWYYTAYNAPTLYTLEYSQLLDNKPAPQVQITTVALGGTIAGIISFVAILAEYFFVPRQFPVSTFWFWRLVCTLVVIIFNIAPSIYIYLFLPLNVYSVHGTLIAIIQFIFSIITFLYFAIKAPSRLFEFEGRSLQKKTMAKVFMSSFPKLPFRSRVFSYMLWASVFAAKFSESYFFLTLSIKDPVRVLSIMTMKRCVGDVIFGNIICLQQARITLVLLLFTDLILFFLDTYLWYIVCNCLFSIGLSYSLGVSIFTPWRNIFLRLPERISSKIIFSNSNAKANLIAIAHVWNSIIISMYREHLLSTEQVNKLVFQNLSSLDPKESSIKSPLFFIYQDDNSFNMGEFFAPGKEAERRISYFAQSLSCPLPNSYPLLAIPSFTVLVPHYSERIILQLREIVKEDRDSKVSLLEYLKQLYPKEWEYFVKDTKVLDFLSSDDLKLPLTPDIHQEDSSIHKVNDLPYYCVGFKNSSPEYILRTRIWASLRSQTLYRTTSGFMNYEIAIRLLYKIENSSFDTDFQSEEFEAELKQFVSRKFRLLVSMQRFQQLSPQEKEDVFTLFKNYPHIEISYLEEEDLEDGTVNYYSTLIDSENSSSDGLFKKFRIRLSGNPILGDGKSDNQNNSLIFTRGEYIQVIDANQDNYLEECLKIKSVLAEFEEMELDRSLEYINGQKRKIEPPIAILGAREYIFSENIGVLGDIAAGKEQTFGTLFARTLAEIGGKLHYGHPDFLNAVFMSTRGGISKAQRGLHLNEDIYAGMTATCRGGRIKHCDFYQCGKGRDLGFGTILNFTTKIGSGMGEQLLSREYYYLGCSLPIDRFLSFYYAHAGFHINNVFIMLSLQCFLLVLVNLGSLVNESIICEYNSQVPITDLEIPIGCYNLTPMLSWISRFVLSIFICFFISFIPLIIQELLEKGVFKSLYRICYHFTSMAPLFEVFVCQIYASSLRDNIMLGGAKYIATGRGFATSRMPFATLYSRYSSMSIYGGVKVCLIIIFATTTMWQPALLWFWVTIISMCFAPFIFNPHQFEWSEFFLDYRIFIRWLSRGNLVAEKTSWLEMNRTYRSRLNGTIGKTRTSTMNIFVGKIVFPFIESLFFLTAFMFINSQNGVFYWFNVNPLLRITIITILPFLANAIILLILSPVSVLLVSLTGCCCNKSQTIVAGFAHSLSLIFNIANIWIFLYLEEWNFNRTLCGIIFMIDFHEFISDCIIILFCGKESPLALLNYAWWSGNWFGTGLGWNILIQPINEYFRKIVELNQFAKDFLIGHVLFFALLPFVYIPYIDRWHSRMLFWLKKSNKFQKKIISKRQKRKRSLKVLKYYILLHTLLLLFISIILAPIFVKDFIPNIKENLPVQALELFQPNNQNNNDTGESAPWYIPREKPIPVSMSTIA
ncbi:1,3-beta-glucan synthase component-domain-containing protein [Scheffersomyces coipomensis]|uniref:1,3-beta-glucan synthase component-domain-containing protein n=1 Tax=Scheffersomyces coipomensis TaxID=1788519 RepID=UPI00315D645C